MEMYNGIANLIVDHMFATVQAVQINDEPLRYILPNEGLILETNMTYIFKINSHQDNIPRQEFHQTILQTDKNIISRVLYVDA